MDWNNVKEFLINYPVLVMSYLLLGILLIIILRNLTKIISIINNIIFERINLKKAAHIQKSLYTEQLKQLKKKSKIKFKSKQEIDKQTISNFENTNRSLKKIDDIFIKYNKDISNTKIDDNLKKMRINVLEELYDMTLNEVRKNISNGQTIDYFVTFAESKLKDLVREFEKLKH